MSFETSQSVGTVIGTDVFRGHDATFDFNPVTLSGTDQLLFQLNLDGVTAGSYSIGVLSATFLRDQRLADPMDLRCRVACRRRRFETGQVIWPRPFELTRPRPL